MNLLYQSQYFSSYQSDKGRCFYIDFGHKMVKMSLCQLLAFRQQVKIIDLDAHISGENHHGMEIITLCNREHIFIINTREALDLRELMKGTFAMLELNSLISCSG